MEKPNEYRYSERTIDLVCRILYYVHLSLPFLLVLYGYLIWKFSPDNITAAIFICFTTTLPVHLLVGVFDIFCRIAILFRKLYPSVASDVFCEVVKFFAALSMVLHGKIIHGFEMHGKENLPTKTGGLVVYHHGLIAYDVLYILCEQSLLRQTVFGGIINRQLWTNMAGVCGLFHYYTERDQLVESLKQGHHCAVAPGGGIEGTFSRNYELVWNGRTGFAKVAKECGVPVIPMFTVNNQQAMPLVTYGFYDFFRELYARRKKYLYIPLVCFPVKMKTFFGKPIYCGVDESPAEFAERVKAAIYDLRDKHQRQPGNLAMALLERIGLGAFKEENGYRKKQ